MSRTAFLFSALLLIHCTLFAAEQPIELQTPTGVIKGTLTLPAGTLKTPVVSMIAGSGPTDRHGNTPVAVGRNASLKLLAAVLGDKGIASVRYDKRGIAASGAVAVQESDLRVENILKTLEAGHLVGDVPTPLLALSRPSVQPYFMSWFAYTPAVEIAKLQIPCLIVHGGTDIQVDVIDAEKLKAGNKACSLKVIAGMNHVMKMVPADRDKQIASYGDPALPVSMELTEALVRFILQDKKTTTSGSHHPLVLPHS